LQTAPLRFLNAEIRVLRIPAVPTHLMAIPDLDSHYAKRWC